MFIVRSFNYNYNTYYDCIIIFDMNFTKSKYPRILEIYTYTLWKRHGYRGSFRQFLRFSITKQSWTTCLVIKLWPAGNYFPRALFCEWIKSLSVSILRRVWRFFFFLTNNVLPINFICPWILLYKLPYRRAMERRMWHSNGLRWRHRRIDIAPECIVLFIKYKTIRFRFETVLSIKYFWK